MPSKLTLALVGPPNSGKTALFNLITGGRYKTGNYAGVTVDRVEGKTTFAEPKLFPMLRGTFDELCWVDLPGAYALVASTEDERIALEQFASSKYDANIFVVDALVIERQLLTISQFRFATQKPSVLIITSADRACAVDREIDLLACSQALGIPVVSINSLGGVKERDRLLDWLSLHIGSSTPVPELAPSDLSAIRKMLREWLPKILVRNGAPSFWTNRWDRFLLHPGFGPVFFSLLLLALFQLVFTWAGPLQDGIEDGVTGVQALLSSALESLPLLRSFVSDGMVGGVGSVLVFLPQILILFGFIHILEDSGLLARAAFLLERGMRSFGLAGQSFIALLSGHACAVPAVMATRTIASRRDRVATMFAVPLMACSARLPVYALLISAFIPDQVVAFGLHWRGLSLFFLYIFGIFAGLFVAKLTSVSMKTGESRLLAMELPLLQRPSFLRLLRSLWDRAKIFLTRVGTIILAFSVLIWFLTSFPAGVDIENTYAGIMGRALEPLLRPIGFDWRISVALIPGIAAREVMVSAIVAVTKVSAEDQLVGLLPTMWSLPTALSLLVWYVFAPQCMSTIAVMKRELGSVKLTAMITLAYLIMAYVSSWIVYHGAVALGW